MIKERLVFKHEVTWFLIVTFLLTWLLWFPALLIQNFAVFIPLSYNFFITSGIFVPSVMGVIFTYRSGGKKELFSLFKSLIDFRINVKWLLFIFLMLPGVSALSCLMYYYLGGILPQMQFPLIFIPVAFLYILVSMGPLGEEIGWRGFALKRMLNFFSPIKSAVILGIVWSTWHLPLFFINKTTQNILSEFGIVPAICGYLIYTVMISVLITLLYIKSNGSIFGSVLLHTVANLSLGIVPIILTQRGAIITLLVLIVTTSLHTIVHREAMFSKIKVT